VTEGCHRADARDDYPARFAVGAQGDGILRSLGELSLLPS
jgi:hypothetical protein